MTIIQMQYFQEVCRLKSFAKAAEELHVSQPAISAAIRNLEQECGVLLFQRDKNALRITDEGNILLEESRLVMNQFCHLNHVVQNLSLSRRYIRVGLSTLSGTQVYPELLMEYRKRYPDIQVVSREESTGKQFEMLDNGELDVIITIKRFNNMEDKKEVQEAKRHFDEVYGHWPLMDNVQVFCVSTQNPLAREPFVTLERMVKEPLILLDDHFYQTKEMKRRWEEEGLHCNVIHYTSQAYTVERFVEKNIAAGFLPMAVVAANSRIAGLPYAGSESRKIEIFWRKDRYMFFAVKAFIDLAKTLYPKGMS